MNDNDIVLKVDPAPLTPERIREQVQVVQRVLSAVMKRDVHYGVIPGCGKPTLLKPGAEIILTTFRIGAKIHIEDLGDGYDFRYRITTEGFYLPTGNTVGYGVGECSSLEKKYAWRAAVCQEEFDAELETRRQIYYSKNNPPINQVRTNPADLANTILKMAKKRALIDLCLTSTACSDVFEQDLDEEHLAEATSAKTAHKFQEPKAKDASATIISEQQRKRLYAIQKTKSGQTDEHVKAEILRLWNYTSSKDIQVRDYDAIIAWLERGCQNEPQQGKYAEDLPPPTQGVSI
jgi:hypothetical protein